MIRIGLVLALMLVGAGSASGQLYTRAGEETVVEYQEGAWAITVCGTRPVTWYSAEMPEAELGMVAAHESEHRRHMASFDSCAAFSAWKRAKEENRLEAEARAFCAGARYDVLNGRYGSLMSAVWAQAKVFTTYSLWDTDEAATAIYRNCHSA